MIEQFSAVIGGEKVSAASGETMEILNPATGEAIATAPRFSEIAATTWSS